jgi:hypothetical protein
MIKNTCLPCVGVVYYMGEEIQLKALIIYVPLPSLNISVDGYGLICLRMFLSSIWNPAVYYYL